MISIVIVSILLFLVAFPAGKVVLEFTGKNKNIPITDYLFTGAAFINTIFSGYSIFFPTSDWPVIIILIMAVIISLKMKWYQGLFKVSMERSAMGVMVLFGILICIIAADGPRNGDSLSYHIPAIRWIQEYAVVPGLGNLHGRFAFNPNIFNLMAGFAFTGITGYPVFAVNAFFCFFFFWYLYSLYRNRNDFEAGTQIFFMLIGMLSVQYMMLRLSSPTPDLVAGLLPLYIFMRFIEDATKDIDADRKTGYGFIFMLTILGIYLFTVKISTVFIVFVPLILLWKFKDRISVRQYLMVGVCGMFIAIPWLVRNYFLGGYLVFPSTIPDLFNPDWKVPAWAVNFDKDIIYNWAKWPRLGAEKVENMSIPEWMPFWFSKLSAFWKVFLCFGLVSPLLVASLYGKRRNEGGYKDILTMWMVSFAGVLFWFFSAPDPRFGFPFILVFTLSFLLFLKPGIESKPRIRIILNALGILFILVSLGFPLKDVIGLRNQLAQTIIKPLPIDTYATEKLKHEVAQYSVEKIQIDPVYYPVCKTQIDAIIESGRSDEVELVFRGNRVQDGFRMKTVAN